MRNAGLDEAQAGIKIAGRNINNLRYAADTTLMAESEEELKRLLIAGSQHGESRPWQRSWGKGPDKRKGGIRPQGSPWIFSSVYPQNQSLPALLCYTFYLLFWHYRGAVPHHLPLKGVNFELQLISLLDITRVSQSKNPSDGFVACLTGLSRILQLRMWLFIASWLWEAQEPLKILGM